MEATKAVGWPEQTKNYIEEVKAEMRRVSWPTWPPQVRATTGVVIAAVFLFAAYFWVIDAVVSNAINKLIRHLHASLEKLDSH